MKKPEYIMIHHTAVSYDKNGDQFEANNEYHKKLWNFKSSLGYYLGYNYEIAANGRVMKAREEGEETAAAYQESMNDGRCVHIALDGNFDIEKPKPEQIFALRDSMRAINNRHSIKRENIIFHRDVANKSCPGNNIDIDFIRSLVYSEDETPDIKEQIFKKLGEIEDLVNKL